MINTINNNKKMNSNSIYLMKIKNLIINNIFKK